MNIEEILKNDIPQFKIHYEQCDKYEKIHFKSRLKKYECQFKNQIDFLKWYFKVIA